MKKLKAKRTKTKEPRHDHRGAGANTSAVALSVINAARRAGVGRSLAYREIKAGKLRALKAGRRTLIRTADLDAWLAGLPPV